MNSHALPDRHIVLTLVCHCGTEREHRLYGGPVVSRFLNVTGRWASKGTEAVPLLSWPDLDSAEAHAIKASSSRGRQVEVSSVAGRSFGCFEQYGEQHAAALIGYLPYGAAAARKLETERQRLMGYAKVILAAGMGEADADPANAVSAMKAAACELRLAGIGNGSWVSAAQGLTGKRALEVFYLVSDGELPCDPGMTPADIWKAIAVATALTAKM